MDAAEEDEEAEAAAARVSRSRPSAAHCSYSLPASSTLWAWKKVLEVHEPWASLVECMRLC